MRSDLTFMKSIGKNVLFHSIKRHTLKTIISHLKEVNFADGDIIFEDGSKGNCLYLIGSGGIKLSKSLRAGKEMVLGILHAGDFFGELDLIDSRNRSAQATAIGDCKLAKLQKKDFDRLIKTNHTFVFNLLYTISLRLRSNNLTYGLEQESSLMTLKQQLIKTHQLVDAAKIVNSSLDIDKLLDLIFQTAARVVGADRGTLYLIDEMKKEIWSKVQKGSSRVEIRLPIGSGIAGTVAATGATINIPDAYADPRFNRNIDQLTGYRTKSTLCMPMKNRKGKIIGVFQLLNRTSGAFTREDEEFIEAFSVHASLAIENAQIAQRMIQNERLSAVGKMASTIIHDIKNPMGVIRLSAQVIRSRAKDSEIKNFADDMIEQVDHFLSMTQDVLDFARGIRSIKFELVNSAEVMEPMMRLLENDLRRRGIKVEKDLRSTGVMRIDPEKLQRAFYNIASNAADAMTKRGKIIIRTFKMKDRLAIEFTDNGCGMSEEVKSRIFEPFFTSGKKRGTGLGMAIVKKIVDDHKGSIEIESRVGKGTTVRLLLPMQ